MSVQRAKPHSLQPGLLSQAVIPDSAQAMNQAHAMGKWGCRGLTPLVLKRQGRWGGGRVVEAGTRTAKGTNVQAIVATPL